MGTQTLNQLNGVRVGQPPPWVSGSTVAQWQLRTSPLDGEVYQRKTATGSGATDPANDLTNYTAASYARTAAITNAWSAGGAPLVLSTFTSTATNLLVATSTPAAGVRTQLLSVTGKGILDAAAIFHTGGVAHTARSELIIDGRPVFDATNSFVVTSSQVVAMTGTPLPTSVSGQNLVLSKSIEFSQSLAIWVTLSVTPAASRFFFGYDMRLKG